MARPSSTEPSMSPGDSPTIINISHATPAAATSTSNTRREDTSSSSARQRPSLPPPLATRPQSSKHKSLGPPHQKLKLLRKGKDKTGESRDEDEEEWTFEGDQAITSKARTVDEEPEPMEELIALSSSADKENFMSEPVEERLKKPKVRGIVKKTSRLFSRDKERLDRDTLGVGASTPSLIASTGRQSSFSSANSNDSAVTSGSSIRQQPTPLVRPPSQSAKPRSPRTSHSRRRSQDSQTSLGAFAPSGSNGSGSNHQRPTANLSASVPSLPRNAFPSSAPPGSYRNTDNVPSRMSTWFSSLLPSSSTATITDTTQSPDYAAPSSSSPARKGPSAAAHFLYAARQKAVDGMRNLLDSEAQPDRCLDTIWVMGVEHPGWTPSTPIDSPSSGHAELPVAGAGRRRGSGSSGKPSPPPKHETLRPSAWPKRKDAISPPPKSFGNLFSTSTLSLALPTSSPTKDNEARSVPTESLGRVAKAKKEKEVLQWPEQFYDDFRSTVWCSYRSQYAPIVSLPSKLLIPTPEAYYSAFGPPADIKDDLPRPSTLAPSSLPSRPPTSPWGWARSAEERGLTSDAGWGCMLRTGQSMLANALIRLHLGRDWRIPDKAASHPATTTENVQVADYATYVRILSWFFDDPSPLCPFSVHRMALIGKELGKEVGEWFGPSTAAGALKTLANSFPPSGLAVATATDSMVYKSDVYAASNLPGTGWFDDQADEPNQRTSSERTKTWGDKAVLILIGLRLGLDGVNPIYHDSVKALFTFPQSVGIAGGRPSSSYYFIGSQANSLFYLDPHTTRPAVPLQIPPSPVRRVKPMAQRHEGGRGHHRERTEDDEPVMVESPIKKGIHSIGDHELNVVNVDDVSDDSESSSPRGQVKREPRTPQRVARTRSTSDASPTRQADPETPTALLASTPVRKPQSRLVAESSNPTPTGPKSSVDAPNVAQPDAATAWYANAYSEAQLRSFHCDKVKKLPLSGLDPSMLLGFLCRDQAEFDDFCDRVARLPQKIFTVQDEPPSWDEDDDPGLESVSEPDMDEEATSTSVSPESHRVVDLDLDLNDDDDLDIETATTRAARAAREIERDAPVVAAMKTEAVQRAELEEEEADDWVSTSPVAGTGLGGAHSSESAVPTVRIGAHDDNDPAGDAAGAGQEKKDTLEGVEELVITKISKPKPRPLQTVSGMGVDMGSGSGINSQSWIKPVTGGEEAPNGRSVL